MKKTQTLPVFQFCKKPPEPAQELDQWMQRKAKVDEKKQQTGVCEHFESIVNAASPQSDIQRGLELVLRHSNVGKLRLCLNI